MNKRGARGNAPWTCREEDEALRLSVEERLTAAQIAERLGTHSTASVMWKLQRLKLKAGMAPAPRGRRR